MHILINETKCPLPSKVFNPHIAYIEIIGIFTKQTIWLICSYLVDQLYFYTVSRYLYAHDTIPLSHETVIHLYNILRSNFCTIVIHFLFIGSLLVITNSLSLEKPTDGSCCSYDKHRLAKTTWHYMSRVFRTVNAFWMSIYTSIWQYSTFGVQRNFVRFLVSFFFQHQFTMCVNKKYLMILCVNLIRNIYKDCVMATMFSTLITLRLIIW